MALLVELNVILQSSYLPFIDGKQEKCLDKDHPRVTGTALQGLAENGRIPNFCSQSQV